MKKSRGGFTLIEMALSLAFIGILSVMMVVLIQNTTSSYRRGLILNQLNTVGMDLIDDIRASVQGAATDSLFKLCQRIYGGNGGACALDKGNSFSIVTKYGDVKIKKDDGSYENIGAMPVPVYGAFCTGMYTYIWNSGYFDNGRFAQEYGVYEPGTGTTIGKARLVNAGDVSDTIADNFRLLKIYDRERTVCRNANNAQNNKDLTNTTYVSVPGVGAPNFAEYNKNVPDGPDTELTDDFKISSAMLSGSPSGLGDKNDGGAVELLKRNNVNDLVIYDFYMTRPAMSETRKNLFFAGSFILGTRRGGINVMVSGNSCKPPSDNTGYSDLEYCAINKFNFAVQAGGK